MEKPRSNEDDLFGQLSRSAMPQTRSEAPSSHSPAPASQSPSQQTTQLAELQQQLFQLQRLQQQQQQQQQQQLQQVQQQQVQQQQTHQAQLAAAPQPSLMMSQPTQSSAPLAQTQAPQFDTYAVQRQLTSAVERILTDRLDVQFGKITQLLSDLTMRVLSTESKIEIFSARLADDSGKKEQASRLEALSRKLDDLSAQVRDVKSSIPSSFASSVPAPAPAPKPLVPDVAASLPWDFGNMQMQQQSQQQPQQPMQQQQQPMQQQAVAPMMTPQSMPMAQQQQQPQQQPQQQYAMAPPMSQYQQQVPIVAPAPAPAQYMMATMPPPQQQYAPQPYPQPPAPPAYDRSSSGYPGGSSGGSGSGSGPATGSGQRAQVQFDENLIQDVVAMGYPRHKVLDGLHQLYSAGKPCNDINVLLDLLEPADSGRSRAQRPQGGSGSNTGSWKLWGR